MNIYYISGLGADKRAFDKLDFVEEYNASYIPWLSPQQKKEDVASYAKRMAKSITGDNPIIVGLSFGGIIAMEIAKLIEVKKVILISSCKTKNELPPQIKMAGSFGLDALVPVALVKKSKPLVYKFLGTHTPEEKEIASDFIDQLDADYLSWSMRTISHWKNTEIACPVFHLHGDRDLLLQSSFLEADHVIKGGNHFMLYNKAEIINPLLNAELQSIQD